MITIRVQVDAVAGEAIAALQQEIEKLREARYG